ncbi:G8 domain-containing protein [Pseudotenacibaculum sp. MALMAid0570]|uniref:G8 domain-containing protein n=1 Tax=Pseudotenacibaculum sp. MALMAid0570 TaxID=3143938 RepID=UPI0032DE4A51
MQHIKYFLIILLSFVSITFSMHAQQLIKVSINDEINLGADAYEGEIQWQISLDNINWSNIDNANEGSFTVVVNHQIAYYRAVITQPNCAPHHSEIITLEVFDTFLWSDPQTWGDVGKPQEGDEVIIPPNKHIILDESPPSLGGLTIQGTLEFDNQDLALTSEWIVVNGTLQIGSEASPFEHKAIITLNDNELEASIMEMGTRGIMVMGGNLELHGAIPTTLWTKINQHADQGSTSLTLIENVDWQNDDEIIIAPTDYYEAGVANNSITQRVSITDINNNIIQISEGLNAFRWGLLQYPTTGGISLSSDNLVDPPLPDTMTNTTPLVLDERAEVANLTRNIVIQAPNDDSWNTHGFGAHIMVMPNAQAHVEGVEIKRGGQRGRLRRYPFHWHMLSYLGTETLDDATGQYFRNNSINESMNRGVVIHGTNGVLVQNNIIYSVRGHGIFTENAVERRNTIDGNLVMHVRNPDQDFDLKDHEQGDLGSSAFWISNPDNIVTNNIAADSQTFGFWLAYPERPFGESGEVLGDDGNLLRPNRLEFGVFDNNTAHSNRNDGIHLDDPEVNEDGGTAQSGIQYWSTVNGEIQRFALSRFKTWKNMDNGSWDRGAWTDFYEIVSADNCGRFFAGSGAEGVIERSLVVGTSLNFMMNGTGRPAVSDFQFYPSSAPTAFATYHGAFSMRHNIVTNFPVTELDRAGVFASDDYYLRPVEKSHIRDYGNLIIESHLGTKLSPPHGYFSFAGALWDPYGFWGPENNYLVYDNPFFTFGKTVTTVEPGTDVVGGVSVPGPFYGFLDFVLHGVGANPPQNLPYFDLMGILVNRYTFDNQTTPVGTWEVDTATDPTWAFQHMRDFATSPDGVYELTFPDETVPPTDFQMSVENMLEITDTQVLGIEYDGTLDPTVFIQQTSNLNNWFVYSEVSSLQDVIDSDGETWWQDKPNNRIWIKLRGGRWVATSNDLNDFESMTYERMLLKIRVF